MTFTKNASYIFGAAVIAALGLTLSITLSSATADPEAPASAIALTITSPDIPQELTLCGQTISLDRDDMFERFDRELTSMAYSHGNTLAIIKRANRYFPAMAPILRSEGVPEDMLCLAAIESSLNNRARSGAGAAGFWQLMPATAKELGLEVNDSVDERFNTELATRAACRFLKRAYAKYGDWATVAAAYNGGTGRVSRELNSQLQQSALDLYLTEETSRYPFRLMAMKTILDNPRAFGFTLRTDQLYMPVECDTVVVDTPLPSWAAWAKDHGTDYRTLRELNPWIRGKSLPNKSRKKYRVAIPASADATLRSRQKQSVFNPAWVVD